MEKKLAKWIFIVSFLVSLPVQGKDFENESELVACYEAMLARNPRIDEGTMHFHWTLTDSGQVEYLKLIHSDLADSLFNECVTETIRGTRMKPAKERIGVVISHKFNFRRNQNGVLEFK